MIHQVLLALAAGLLVGVNPYVAPNLHARLAERGGARSLHIETTLATSLVLVALVALAWRFAGFLSGRLTNSLLFLGLFALAGAFYSLRPFRRRAPDPAPTGWRWLTGYASDVLYYAGPAWVLATAFAMRQVTPASFALPYVAAGAGVIVATFAWTTRWRDALPRAPAAPGEPRTKGHTALALCYASAAVLMLAANLKLI